MAAPNIVGVTSIYARTAYVTPNTTNATIALVNSASSGKVFKINTIIAANVDGTTAVDASVSINTLAAGSGTSYPIVSTVAVPADASLIVIDKSTAFYLEEDKSIIVTSGVANDIAFIISYDEIS